MPSYLPRLLVIFLIPYSIFNHMTMSHLNRAVDKLYISDYIFLRQYWQENIKLLCVQIHTCRNNNHIYKRNYTKIGSLGHWLLLFTDITLTCKKGVAWKLSKSNIAKKIILLNLVPDSVGSKFGHSFYPSYPFGWQHL